ncbi:unnamed protein product [Calypogeia fissa]
MAAPLSRPGRVCCSSVAYGASWWSSVEVGPAFVAPFADGHRSAAEFHVHLLVSLVLDSFAPCLVWLPVSLLKDFLLAGFRPVLWYSPACSLRCFGCQIIWFRRLQWVRWAFG